MKKSSTLKLLCTEKGSKTDMPYFCPALLTETDATLLPGQKSHIQLVMLLMACCQLISSLETRLLEKCANSYSLSPFLDFYAY